MLWFQIQMPTLMFLSCLYEKMKLNATYRNSQWQSKQGSWDEGVSKVTMQQSWEKFYFMQIWNDSLQCFPTGVKRKEEFYFYDRMQINAAEFYQQMPKFPGFHFSSKEDWFVAKWNASFSTCCETVCYIYSTADWRLAALKSLRSWHLSEQNI